MNQSSLQSSFKDLIDSIGDVSHGGNLSDIRSFMDQKFTKTKERESFLQEILIQDPVLWDNVKNKFGKGRSRL